MSRLSFREDNEFAVLSNNDQDNDSDFDEEEDRDEKHLAMSSYDLMGVPSSGSGGTRGRGSSSGRKKGDRDLKPAAKLSAWSDEDEDPLPSAPVPAAVIGFKKGMKDKKEKKEKKESVRVQAAAVAAPVLSAPAYSPVHTHSPSSESPASPVSASADTAAVRRSEPVPVQMSSWLAGFLGNKKEPGATPAKPEIIPLDGTYIAQFASSAKAHMHDRGSAESDSSSGGEGDEETGLSSSFFEEKDDSFNKIQLKFFNLPYNMTSEAVMFYFIVQTNLFVFSCSTHQ
jgi:hypothetical protein